MSGKQKILEEIHPLSLIREVQRRPSLYTRNNAEMASPHHRLKIWTEIAESLFPDWELCCARTKDDKGLMKKWRNLRDTFKRQLEIQKKIREGASIKKKQYVYFKHMAFLTPHMMEDELEGAGCGSAASASAAAAAVYDHSWQAAASKRPRLEDYSFGSASDFGEIDEDKHFLMSLIPSFKRMNEDEKLTAKMEILKVIKTVKENSASSSAMLSYELVPERAFAEDGPLVGVKLEALAAADDSRSGDSLPDEDSSPTL